MLKVRDAVGREYELRFEYGTVHDRRGERRYATARVRPLAVAGVTLGLRVDAYDQRSREYLGAEFIGSALCSESDTWSKEKARTIALERAVAHMRPEDVEAILGSWHERPRPKAVPASIDLATTTTIIAYRGGDEGVEDLVERLKRSYAGARFVRLG